MGSKERVLLLVGPQHVDETRPVTAQVRRWLEHLSPLGIGIVATMLKEAGMEVSSQEMQPGKIYTLDEEIGQADLVVASSRFYDSGMTREVIELAQKNQVPIVVGGYGPSLDPKSYSGAVVVRGEAEMALPQVINDWRRGRLGEEYDTRGQLVDMSKNYVRPDRSIWPKRTGMGARWARWPQEWERGCPNYCSYCSPIRVQQVGVRARDVGDILGEIDSDLEFASRFLFSTDLNTMAMERERLLDLTNGLNKRGIRWFTEGTVSQLLADLRVKGENDSLLWAMKARKNGGCWSFLYGADDLGAEKVAGSKDKERHLIQEAAEIFRRFKIPFNLSVVVGLDHHTYPDTFFTIASELEASMVPYSFLHVATPYEGTAWGDKAYREDRVFDNEPLHHNHRRVVHRPLGMTAEQLQQGYYWLLRELYSPKRVIEVARKNFDLASWQEDPLLGLFLTGYFWGMETYAAVKELELRGRVDLPTQRELTAGFEKWTKNGSGS